MVDEAEPPGGKTLALAIKESDDPRYGRSYSNGTPLVYEPSEDRLWGEMYVAFARRLHILGECDQLLDHLRSGEGVVVIAVDGRLQPLAERFVLNDVGTRLRFDLAVEELSQRLHRQICLLHVFDLSEKII